MRLDSSLISVKLVDHWLVGFQPVDHLTNWCKQEPYQSIDHKLWTPIVRSTFLFGKEVRRMVLWMKWSIPVPIYRFYEG